MHTRSLAICILFVACTGWVACESEPVAPQVEIVREEAEPSCQMQQGFSTILLVGLFSSLVFCFIGILPAFFIRTDADEEKFKNSLVFKFLLAFAAGSLMSEVFLHLIPEATNGSHSEKIHNGLFAILAFFIFLVIEKITGLIPHAHALGTLNLVANFFDNSAHGTTVVGAFQVSATFGMIALIATIIHEVPHEFSDFALLLRDGYSRKKAILFQLITAMAGTIGATISYALTTTAGGDCGQLNVSHLSPQHAENQHQNSIALPFTIGGFLYIALVGIVPEIVEEEDRKISLLQLFSFISGVIFIYLLVEIEMNLPDFLH